MDTSVTCFGFWMYSNNGTATFYSFMCALFRMTFVSFKQHLYGVFLHYIPSWIWTFALFCTKYKTQIHFHLVAWYGAFQCNTIYYYTLHSIIMVDRSSILIFERFNFMKQSHRTNRERAVFWRENAFNFTISITCKIDRTSIQSQQTRTVVQFRTRFQKSRANEFSFRERSTLMLKCAIMRRVLYWPV